MEVYHVIVEEMRHEYMETASWGAQLFIVVIAIAAAIVALRQLGEMSRYRRQRLRIANAQLLMHLDNRWDSHDLHNSRLSFRAMRNAIHAKIGSENPRVGDAERKNLMKQEWANNLREKRANDPEGYSRLMAMCGFFETVGLMVQREYIQIDDVLELFLGPIIDIDMCFGGHIAELEKEMGTPVGLYKHALNLSRQAARRAQ